PPDSRMCTDFNDTPSARPIFGVEKLTSSCFFPLLVTPLRFVVASIPGKRGARSMANCSAIASANRVAYVILSPDEELGLGRGAATSRAAVSAICPGLGALVAGFFFGSAMADILSENERGALMARIRAK